MEGHLIEIEGLKKISIILRSGRTPFYDQYRVVSSMDKMLASRPDRCLMDAHLFSPDELLELADFVEQNRDRLEQGRL